MNLIKLTVEYMKKPIGIGRQDLVFGWNVHEESKNSVMQVTYHIIVKKDGRVVWDSKVIESSRCNGVRYEGEALESGTSYQWIVSVTDNYGRATTATSEFGMGMLNEAAWNHSKWIGNQGEGRVTNFLKCFTTEKKDVCRAIVYASALGHYELNLNGEKVGNQYMAPGWTNYDRRVQYQAYDVTDQIMDGENRMGALLAPGWYAGNISVLGKNRYGNTNALIANLVIEYLDGTRQVIVTDDTWRFTTKGPILETDMFDGEIYDGNLELGGSKYGWTTAGFDYSSWCNAKVLFDSAYSIQSRGKRVELTAQIGQGVTKIAELEPVSITEVCGKWIVDMGQNFAGIAKLSLVGRKGEAATIRYAEMLNDDEKGSRGCDNQDGVGSIYTANYRSAKSMDCYIFKSDNKEVWEPTFTFHGFRYIEISGCKKPEYSDIKGYALASVNRETGSFESSSKLMNQIYSNSFWGQRSNFLSIPTDCPQRDERMGWGADAHVYSRTGLYNMDSNMFYQKWLQDVRDEQYEDGGYPDIAPNPHNFRNDVVWAAGGVIIPYDIWMMTGDMRILEDSYMSMKKYMKSRTNGGLVQRCRYGDWLEPIDGASDKEVIGTTYLAYQYHLMTKIAAILGDTREEMHYQEEFHEVKTEFHKTLVEADGRIRGNAQSAYVLALAADLQTSNTELPFVEKLVANIIGNNNLMSVGFVSVNQLMPVLSKYGYSHIAYALATNTAYPSWGYSIEQGATTIWERWNSYTKEKGFGPVSMNSFNHYAFGSVTEWFYSGIGGMKPDKKNPGFENIIIQPQFDLRTIEPLTRATVSYDSVRGKISSRWEVEADSITLIITIPANATATVILPSKAKLNKTTKVQVGSGIHTFKIEKNR